MIHKPSTRIPQKLQRNCFSNSFILHTTKARQRKATRLMIQQTSDGLEITPWDHLTPKFNTHWSRLYHLCTKE